MESKKVEDTIFQIISVLAGKTSAGREFHIWIIGLYKPSVRITASLLTPLMLNALILYMSGWTYS